uniref:Zinc finger PHD-type domain-containing protein n=1 Tax=Hyaloperonospora arabidopsidis (strain Emoy2) TaxID=559515 RepID=M4B4L1_HYAAE
MATSACVDQQLRCTECDLIESNIPGAQLLVCMSCKLAVHESCYVDALHVTETKRKSSQLEESASKSAGWRCDCCIRDVQRQKVTCVYCGKSGGALKELVETGDDDVAFFWSRYARFPNDSASEMKDTVQFGHVLCIKWDPRCLAAARCEGGARMKPGEEKVQGRKRANSKRKVGPSFFQKKKSKMKPVERMSKKELANAKDVGSEASRKEVENKTEGCVEQLVEEVMPDIKEVLRRDLVPSGDCCFCKSSRGVRIQCRRVHCARDFHVMCAHQGNGHVELRTGRIMQFHAYCDRHCECTEDIGDLLAKLITRPIRLLVGRDDMRRFGTVAKHLPDYASAAAVMRDLAALMVGYCDKGLRASKSNPPEYNVKHLQVLQFFLSHVPQLEKVYALPPMSVRELVNDTRLVRRLERTFDPPGYSAQYPGPSSQQYTCAVCLDPFHERQHLFYCSIESESAIPHVQHWRCTKRRSSAREPEKHHQVEGSTSTTNKRNTISIVQNGVQKDIAIPKGLSSMTGDVICGVCGAAVNTRGLIGSCKEAKQLDFEKKESKFVQNGCYINPVGAKGYCYGPDASSRKWSARSTDGKHNGNTTGQNAVAHQATRPPKMDRINVQRTTKWLTCVARIIRLIGAAASNVQPPPYSASAASSKAGSGNVTSTVAASSISASTAYSAPDSNEAASTEPFLGKRGSSISGTSTTATATSEQFRPSTVDSKVWKPMLPATATTTHVPTSLPVRKETPSLITPAIQAHFDEVMRLVRPYDSYALNKLETAYDMLRCRNGPGVGVLRMFTHEYTRFVYIKHTRAVERARNEKRKRAEYQAQENRAKERKRMNLEAEQALKKQMLAMRNKQRQHHHKAPMSK